MPVRKRPIREPGYIFGYWEVLEYIPCVTYPRRRAYYKVLCTLCKTEYTRQADSLEGGGTIKCDICKRKCIAVDTHANATGLSQETLNFLIKRWARIKQNCYNKNNQDYNYYGARGISMCNERRKDVRAFLMYIKDLPGVDDPNLEIDRIDNDGNYMPGNIRFCTHSENVLNSRWCL